MKSKLLFLSTIIVSLLLLTACTDKNSDAYKFKQEYESLNGTTNSYGKQIREIAIEEENPVIYKIADEIVEMIKNNETFVVYFGFASCPWCRSVLPTLLSVSEDLGLKTLYYVDVTGIRDTLELNEKKELVTKTKGTDAYYKLLELLDNVLDNYSMKDDSGKDIDTHEKRIYAPNVVGIINGKAEKMTTGISSLQNDAYMDLTEEMVNETYEKFKCTISCVLDSTKTTCSLDKAC